MENRSLEFKKCGRKALVANFISAKDFDKSKVWGDLQNGSLLLTDVVEPTALQSQFVYQLENVAAWINEQLACHSEVTPQYLEEDHVNDSDWYLIRGQDIYGPMPLPAIAYLQIHNHTLDEDLCFSLKFRLKIKTSELSSIAATPLKEQTFHLNRSSKRWPAFFDVTLMMEDNILMTVTTTNISGGGSAVISKTACKVGTPVQFVLRSFESIPEFRCEAIVSSCKPVEGGYQLGLEFEHLDRHERRNLFRHDQKWTAKRKAG